MNNTNHIIEVKGHSVIGILCINDKNQGFLHYTTKFTNESETKIDPLLILPVYEKARMFCMLKNVELYMY